MLRVGTVIEQYLGELTPMPNDLDKEIELLILRLIFLSAEAYTVSVPFKLYYITYMKSAVKCFQMVDGIRKITMAYYEERQKKAKDRLAG